MGEEMLKSFPELTDEQRRQIECMLRLYPEWNEKINVISRKDIDNLEVNHILHSLGIAKFIRFSDGSRVMDLGCGGGFPGIPLAMLFPKVHFILIDRTAKKLRVAEEVARAAGIANVEFIHGDASECKQEVDFVVSRAVMPQGDLLKIVRKNISKEHRNAIPNGLITLKGGELEHELQGLKSRTEVVGLNQFFPQPFFDTKKIVYTAI